MLQTNSIFVHPHCRITKFMYSINSVEKIPKKPLLGIRFMVIFYNILLAIKKAYGIYFPIQKFTKFKLIVGVFFLRKQNYKHIP